MMPRSGLLGTLTGWGRIDVVPDRCLPGTNTCQPGRTGPEIRSEKHPAEPFTVSNVVSGHVTGNVVMVGQVDRIIVSAEDTDETNPR
jgi:hypothetical protein